MNESVLNRICDGGNASLLCEDNDGLPLARGVDLDRFMGDWYVIAAIPTLLERGIENAVETYQRRDDGWIDTTFRYSRGARERSWQFKGKVLDECNGAVWGMQIVWPMLADYRILYVDDAYRQTVIGRRKRDYAWIMSRTPELAHSDLFERVRLLRECGYDTARLRRMVHRPRAAVGTAAAD